MEITIHKSKYKIFSTDNSIEKRIHVEKLSGGRIGFVFENKRQSGVRLSHSTNIIARNDLFAMYEIASNFKKYFKKNYVETA